MIDLEAINLDAAKAHFALANLPSYIARKLREDTAIVNIAMENGCEEIFDEFLARVEAEPTTLREQVYPFALAVAVALKGELPTLRRMAALDLSNFHWLAEVIKGLINQQPTASTDVALSVDDFVKDSAIPRSSDAVMTRSGFSDVRLS